MTLVSSGFEGKEEGLVPWRRLAAVDGTNSSVQVVDNSSFILAAGRTHRRDPLNNFKDYTHGWNISEKHYWAVSSSFIYHHYYLSSYSR